MKIKIEGIQHAGVPYRVLTKVCPYPEQCSRTEPPKVGSMACDNCIQHKGDNKDYVYCAAGDKRPRKLLD